jgi:DNA-binding transcriptional regulator YbjK
VSSSHNLTPVFDDPNLVTAAGLWPAMKLADRLGLPDILNDRLTVNSPNRVGKSICLLMGMLQGADSIDDLNLLRTGGTGRLLDGVWAPSTLGTFLRDFTWCHARQLGTVNHRLLDAMAAQLTGLPGQTDGEIVFVDLDDTIINVHGHHKQGVRITYKKTKGLDAVLATLATTTASPLIAAAELRGGSKPRHSLATRLTAAAIHQARRINCDNNILVRADSGYYGTALTHQAIRKKAWFSITTRQTGPVNRAIATIADNDWTATTYDRPLYDEELRCEVAEAEVAEVTDYVAFEDRAKKDQVTCRLVVRRVKAWNHTDQDSLFPVYRYQAFITNSTLTAVEADRIHRHHAIIEQVNAELKDNALNHLPSGRFGANAAWLMFAVLTYNLSRAIGYTAGLPTARQPTIRRRLIAVPGRLAHSARRYTLHLPRDWPWQDHWWNLHTAATGPPGHTPCH